MTRNTFGNTTNDKTFRRLSTFMQVTSATLTFWDAEVGGTQYTDLLDAGGNPVESVTSDSNGKIPSFQGPDGVTEMWVDDGGGRELLVSVSAAAGAVAGAQAAETAAQGHATDAAGYASDAQAAAATATAPTDTTMASKINTAGSATRVALDAAYAAHATDLIVYVSTGGNDSKSGLGWGQALATIDAALAKVTANGGGVIELGGGTFAPPASGVPSHTLIRGRGRGVTVIQAPANYGKSLLVNSDTINGNVGLGLCDLTIDGNLANQSAQAAAAVITANPTAIEGPGTTVDGAIMGVDWRNVFRFVINNVEVKGVDGKGLYILGPGGANITEAAANYGGMLSNIFAHDNGLDGIHVGFGLRKVQWLGVFAYHNGRDGACLDVSEAQVTSLNCYANARDGMLIRNVFAAQFNGLVGNRNGRHGIHVVGLTSSNGASWTALNNGQGSNPNGVIGGISGFTTSPKWAAGYNVYFDSYSSMSYGVSKNSEVHGINCDHNQQWDGTVKESYNLWVDDTVTQNLMLTGLAAFIPGTSGAFRFPATQAGDTLVALAHSGGTNRLNLLRGDLYLNEGRIRNSDTINLPAPTVSALPNGTDAPTPTLTEQSAVRGTVSFGSGATPSAGSNVVNVGYGKNYSSAPLVFIQPLNAATAGLNLYVSAHSTSGFNVGASNAAAASKAVGTYAFSYYIVIPTTTV